MRTPRIRVEKGDALKCLAALPSGRFHAVMTTPSTFGSVDYEGTSNVIGAEETFEEHLENLVTVFGHVRRVLRHDGVFFLHYGDSRDRDGELQMLPARVALALQEDTWHLRSEITVNPYEKVYLFTWNKKFYWDDFAAPNSEKRLWTWLPRLGKIERPHFAHCPEKIMETLFKMGIGQKGCCEECGASRYRSTEEIWLAGCGCGLVDDIPCRVLDPFYGSGTTGVVAAKLGLDCYGIEMNPKWIKISEERLETKVGTMFVDYKKKIERVV